MKNDQIKGRLKVIEGKTKEAIGKLIGDKELEIKGTAQKTAGKAQATYGDLENELDKRD